MYDLLFYSVYSFSFNLAFFFFALFLLPHPSLLTYFFLSPLFIIRFLSPFMHYLSVIFFIEVCCWSSSSFFRTLFKSCLCFSFFITFFLFYFHHPGFSFLSLLFTPRLRFIFSVPPLFLSLLFTCHVSRLPSLSLTLTRANPISPRHRTRRHSLPISNNASLLCQRRGNQGL